MGAGSGMGGGIVEVLLRYIEVKHAGCEGCGGQVCMQTRGGGF